MEYIKTKKRKDVLRFGFLDENDKPLIDNKGEEVFWEFDLGDIELPLKWSKVEHTHKKNLEWIRGQFVIIDKKEDVKTDKMISKKEEDKIKTMQEFYKKEIDNLNNILGENGVEKFLNGRNPYWEMFDDINDAMETVLPKFENAFKGIGDRIKKKYKDEEEKVLE